MTRKGREVELIYIIYLYIYLFNKIVFKLRVSQIVDMNLLAVLTGRQQILLDNFLSPEYRQVVILQVFTVLCLGTFVTV